MKKNKESAAKRFVCGILLSLVFISNADQGAHLKPLPLILTSYDVVVHTSLLGGSPPHLYMIILPGLTRPRSAIIIDNICEYEEYTEEEVHDSSWRGPKLKSEKWILKHTAFKHPLVFKGPFDPTAKYDVDLTNDIERIEIDIDAEFATLMTKAWLRILSETRYPTEINRSMISDGPSYIFQCCRDYDVSYPCYGMTDSSSNMELIELGLKLISLVKADGHDREQLQKQCIELATRIIKKEKGSTRKEVSPGEKGQPVNSGVSLK